MDTNSIYIEMTEAAVNAAMDKFNEFGQTDMVGACGFAWVTINPKHKGNTKLGKEERKVLAALKFEKDWTGKSYQLWDPANYSGQNVDIKEAGARAAAVVLRKHGFDAYAGSRLDQPMVNLNEEYSITGWDPSYKVVFHASWSDYEESGWIAIMENGHRFYSQTGGYCVMADNGEDRWDPQLISEDEAIELMLEWEEHER